MELRFGDYRIRPSARQLVGPNGPVDLSARSFDILSMLLGKPDDVIGKSELLETVWPGLIVEDNTLQVHVSALRKALDPGMIKTVHGRGYKYVGPPPTAVAGTSSQNGIESLPQEDEKPSHKPSIAVLPFANMSDDPDQVYFSDGITEDIITELGRFRELLVIARNSSFRFRDTSTDVAEVAGQLGVQYVVQGSVRKIANRVRISVQLIDAGKLAHVWGEHYDRELTDIFAIQDEITQMIAARLARQARTAIVARGRLRPTSNMSAYDYYLRALQLSATYDTVRDAEPLLRRAVELDPEFAAAYALLSFVESIHFYWEYDNWARLESGLKIAAAALRLDPNEAYGHLATGFANLYSGRFRQAETSLDHAVSLNPNDPFILSIHALLLNYTGRPENALAELEEAQRRDPFAIGWMDDFRGIVLTTGRRFGEAIACYEGLDAITSWSLAHFAIACAELGDMPRAKEVLGRLKAVWPDLSLEDIVRAELDFFEDRSIPQRYLGILRRVDASV
ncbi:winged helix-turn-helix domain-containing protein [Frigidibacter sp. RF13]|uniref:winged helix-turn-helix domain-containing tetratricopeptide repeat protein n=1 Tax=Frigidibacter sp. RF13 TaxID=2997340 RepID=UPI002270F515|nr:winged helix-turn-helix domain-containing protein [Frigidibacter sp. RF13]MCY1127013.1 winged helix-turn-helix domain-containing protein [Frigidibacter sp. RF13]